jgi:murein peptide amidase A
VQRIFLIILSLLSVFIFSCTQFKREQKPIETTIPAVVTPPQTPVQQALKTEIVRLTPEVENYCQEIESEFKRYKWGASRCQNISWHHVRKSHLNRPLIWTTFGSEEGEKKHTIIFLCGVHGDEITPVKFCFDLINHVEAHRELYKDKTIVIAPIVAPDSFFKRPPTRTNARGVDVNRNFPTKDWNALALKLWKEKYKSDKRRFPGEKAQSEAEVIFQINLIKRYNPSKIISVHAPLTLLDYDGPSVLINHPEEREHAEINKQGKDLLKKMSENAKGYQVIDYPVFPGSLGNWSGRELLIPTYTLELPTSDFTKHKVYWEMFARAMQDAILHEFTL